MEEKVSLKRHLKILSKQYTNIEQVAEEIINLQAILNLPKGTELFLSDIHGEYGSFSHILNNGSGIIKSKIETIFKKQITEHERRALATLIYYPEEKLNTALELLGNEVKASDILNEGQFVDAIATTKGKGFQGVVKRWGIRIQYGKAVRAGKGRHVGSIGPWTPSRTMWTVAQAGQMGYHKRTEFNKKILKIASADEVDQINPDGGFVKYGLVKNDYVLVKGSLPGPSKRLVILRQPIRPNNKSEDIPQINYISTKSKQGV